MTNNDSMYEPLRIWQARLLRLYPGIFSTPLRCDLITIDVIYFEGVLLREPSEDRILEYEALSYAWGEPDFVELIVCNGVNYPVTTNLFLALQHIRLEDKPRYLWVDAVCINQHDDVEKGVQVQNMLAIYMKAKQVICWLGMEGQLTDAALDLIKTKEAAAERKKENSPEITKILTESDFCKALKDIYERPWFRRMWVQQEIFAARDLTILCGKRVIGRHTLITPPWVLWRDKGPSQEGSNKRQSADKQFTPLDHIREYRLKGFLAWMSRESRPVYDQDGHLRSREPPGLIETLLKTRTLSATNPRDHVYGILGLTNTKSRAMSIRDPIQVEENFIPIDYSATLLEVYRSVTMYILKRNRSLDVLASFTMARLYETTENFPSWVVDWRRTEDKEFSESRPVKSGFELFCQDNSGSQQTNQLFLRGFIEKELVVKNGRVRSQREVRWTSKYTYFEASLSRESDLVVRFSMAHWPCTLRPLSTGEFKIIEFFEDSHYQAPLDRAGNPDWDLVSESEGSVVGSSAEWSFYEQNRSDEKKFSIL